MKRSFIFSVAAIVGVQIGRVLLRRRKLRHRRAESDTLQQKLQNTSKLVVLQPQMKQEESTPEPQTPNPQQRAPQNNGEVVASQPRSKEEESTQMKEELSTKNEVEESTENQTQQLPLEPLAENPSEDRAKETNLAVAPHSTKQNYESLDPPADKCEEIETAAQPSSHHEHGHGQPKEIAEAQNKEEKSTENQPQQLPLEPLAGSFSEDRAKKSNVAAAPHSAKQNSESLDPPADKCEEIEPAAQPSSHREHDYGQPKEIAAAQNKEEKSTENQPQQLPLEPLAGSSSEDRAKKSNVAAAPHSAKQNSESLDPPADKCEEIEPAAQSSSHHKHEHEQSKAIADATKATSPFEVLLLKAAGALTRPLDLAAVANVIAALSEDAFAISTIQCRQRNTNGFVVILERAAGEEAVSELQKAFSDFELQRNFSPQAGGVQARKFTIYCFGQDEAKAKRQEKQLRKYATRYLASKPSKRGNRRANTRSK